MFSGLGVGVCAATLRREIGRDEMDIPSLLEHIPNVCHPVFQTCNPMTNQLSKVLYHIAKEQQG